jgi:hypothetical protein
MSYRSGADWLAVNPLDLDSPSPSPTAPAHTAAPVAPHVQVPVHVVVNVPGQGGFPQLLNGAAALAAIVAVLLAVRASRQLARERRTIHNLDVLRDLTQWVDSPNHQKAMALLGVLPEKWLPVWRTAVEILQGDGDPKTKINELLTKAGEPPDKDDDWTRRLAVGCRKELASATKECMSASGFWERVLG